MLRAQPANPKMASLPDAGLAFRMRPFSHCSLDYFGPINVKIDRRREKRWGALFTCLTVRAVHVEIVNSLSSDSTIMAIKRLSAGRGKRLVFYSYNGTNFKAAANEINQALKDERSEAR